MTSIESLVEKALLLKKNGLTEKEISEELNLSQATVSWLLTKRVEGENPPADVKIGWRSIGVVPSRIRAMSTVLVDICMEEAALGDFQIDAICGVAIKGITYAAFMAEELGTEFMIFRPAEEEGKPGTFTMNNASPEGKNIVVVDDMFDTGGTAKATFKAIRDNGGTPVLAVVLVNKTENNSLDDVPLRGMIRTRVITV